MQQQLPSAALDFPREVLDEHCKARLVFFKSNDVAPLTLVLFSNRSQL